MLARVFEARGGLEDVCLMEAFGRDDRCKTRLAFGHGAGLVEDERVHLLEDLESLGVTDENALVGSATCGDHDRHWRSEPQSARAGDDEHGDGVNQSVRIVWCRAEDGPHDEGNDRCEKNRRNEPGRDLISNALDGSAGALGFADHLDDLCQQSIRSQRVRLASPGFRFR